MAMLKPNPRQARKNREHGICAPDNLKKLDDPTEHDQIAVAAPTVELAQHFLQVLVEMSPTKFGYDYTFDCTGNVQVMRACLEVRKMQVKTSERTSLSKW